MVWGPGQVMDDGSLGARRVPRRGEARVRRGARRGQGGRRRARPQELGLGNGFKEIAKAVVRFDADGTVEVRHCWTEMGQGVHTVAQQVAVEELGVTADRVRVVVDTTRELGAGPDNRVAGTLMGAGAIADACRKARKRPDARPASTSKASTASTGRTR